MQSVSGMVTHTGTCYMSTGWMYARSMQHDSCDTGPKIADQKCEPGKKIKY